MPAAPAEKPIASAEGGPLPEPAAPVPATGAPTPGDYAQEWGQYVATQPIPYGAAIAVAEGGAVPASHPLLQEWIDAGMVVKRD